MLYGTLSIFYSVCYNKKIKTGSVREHVTGSFGGSVWGLYDYNTDLPDCQEGADIMKQKQKSKDARRYVIVIPESGEMYVELLDDGVRPTARKLIGTHRVDVIPSGVDARYMVLFSRYIAADKHNRLASRVAQECLYGPVMIAFGKNPDTMHGFSRRDVKEAMAQFAEIGGYEDV